MEKKVALHNLGCKVNVYEVEIDGNKLGLGTNLFSGEETLREELGANYINKELKRNDKMYNQFY